jgi:hypothetical protein
MDLMIDDYKRVYESIQETLYKKYKK